MTANTNTATHWHTVVTTALGELTLVRDGEADLPCRGVERLEADGDAVLPRAQPGDLGQGVDEEGRGDLHGEVACRQQLLGRTANLALTDQGGVVLVHDADLTLDGDDVSGQRHHR